MKRHKESGFSRMIQAMLVQNRNKIKIKNSTSNSLTIPFKKKRGKAPTIIQYELWYTFHCTLSKRTSSIGFLRALGASQLRRKQHCATGTLRKSHDDRQEGNRSRTSSNGQRWELEMPTSQYHTRTNAGVSVVCAKIRLYVKADKREISEIRIDQLQHIGAALGHQEVYMQVRR